MQLLARLMDHVLAERGQRATIVGATSGDTGGAAIEAFAGRDRTDIFILFPHGRVSPVQQRQMTTSTAANVHALAIEGNFDDCQGLVKEMFNDHGFRDRVSLSGVNSINWARIMAQIVYYFSSALSLGAPGPAGLLHRADRQFRRHLRRLRRQAHGPADRAAGDRHQRQRHPRPHACERRIPDARRRRDDLAVDGHPGLVEFRAAAVRGGRPRCRRRCAATWTGSSSPAPSPSSRARLPAIRAEFDAGRATMAETAATIRATLAGSGYLLDPHTATAMHVADAHATGDVPMVVLATAHPAKFPAAVEGGLRRRARAARHGSRD